MDVLASLASTEQTLPRVDLQLLAEKAGGKLDQALLLAELLDQAFDTIEDSTQTTRT